jgi:hypothetical protein
MKKNVILIIIACSLVICASYIWISYNPIIIHKPYDQNVFLYKNSYNPIDTVDFTQGENKIIIYVNGADVRFLPKEIKKWTLLECKSNKVIEEVKNNFVFERISNNIVETTDLDSRIFFFKNNKLVFSSKIMIEENISLRFQNTGWTFAKNYNELINSFSKFNPIYLPVIKID